MIIWAAKKLRFALESAGKFTSEFGEVSIRQHSDKFCSTISFAITPWCSKHGQEYIIWNCAYMIQLSWYLIFMNVSWKALRSNASIHNNFICWRTLISACSSLWVHDRIALSQGFLACFQTFLIHLTLWNCLVHKTSKFKNNNTCPSKDTLTANWSVQKGVNFDENEMYWELISHRYTLQMIN